MPSRTPLVACALVLAGLASGARPARALEECRLMRQPDIQGTTIVFVYAGDLWTVPRAGGLAARLTAHEGLERFPKLSPDGRTVAFTAEYDGNTDAYTIPVEGGEPRRLTWHPDPDLVAEWYPDGKSILIRSPRASAILRYSRFFKVPATGGFEQLLPLPTAGYASFSPDGGRLAYVSPSYDNRTWKRYRGGNAPQIWVYDFKANAAEKITDWDGANEWPMWVGHTIYYCSDQGGRRANLWAYDVDQKTRRQVTHFEDDDVKWPSAGSDAIVFENGGALCVMDLPGEQVTRIKVMVPDDKPDARAEYRNVAKWTNAWALSPSAKRAVIEARGELFTVPAENGEVRNLTQTPGVRERDPDWSPDGRSIAFLSDAGGEYELHVIASDGRGQDRQVTHGGSTFRFPPRWSPDSKKLAFSDKTRTLWVCDVATGKLQKIDKSEYGEIQDFAWSGDSRWIAYARPAANNFNRIVLASLANGKTTELSDGMTDDFNPSFDPEGRWLYFVSRRAYDLPAFAFEYSFLFARTDKIYAASLRDTVKSPAAAKSDEELGEAGKDEGGAGAKDEKEGKGGKGGGKGKKEEAVALAIDLAGIQGRVAELPIPAGRYSGLKAFKDKLLYVALDEPDPNANGGATGSIHVFDLEKRKDDSVIEGVDASYSASKDGGKVLYKADQTFGIVDAAAGKKSGDGKIAADKLTATVDPPQEWMQMFNEAWRLERDFYYDPAMGGLDWKAIGEHYRKLVP
ncbi:MAG TPA: hypothetical protein VI792_06365, partial [Candidatus Eisenbacteria bacterium]